MTEEMNVEATEVEETLEVEETPEVETEAVTREQYEEALAQAEKYKGYFKKEKAKQKQTPSGTPGVDVNDIEARILQKLELYNSNPGAKDLKEHIDAHMKEGLDINKAFKLAAAEHNPSLLMDQQTVNKQEASKKQLTGVPVNTGGGVDFANVTREEIAGFSSEQRKQFKEYMKKGGR